VWVRKSYISVHILHNVNCNVPNPNNCQSSHHAANIVGARLFLLNNSGQVFSVHGNSKRQQPIWTQSESSEVCVGVIGRQLVRSMTAGSRSVEDEPIFTAIWLCYRDEFVCDTAVDTHLVDTMQTNTNLYSTSSHQDWFKSYSSGHSCKHKAMVSGVCPSTCPCAVTMLCVDTATALLQHHALAGNG